MSCSLATEPTTWLPFAQTLLGGALSLIGGLGGIYLTAHIQQKRDRQSLAGAFAGEIGTIVHLIERRRYAEQLRQILDAPREPEDVPVIYSFSVRQNYFRVYEANADKLGWLPATLANDVTRFYGLCASFLEDVADLRDATLNPAQQALVLPTAWRRMEEMHKMLTDAVALGRQCEARARKLAGGPDPPKDARHTP